MTIASSGPRPEGIEWIERLGTPPRRSKELKFRILVEAAFRRPRVTQRDMARFDPIVGIDLDSFDLVTVHDLDVLAAVLDAQRSCAVLFDARELYPEEQSDRRTFRVLHTRRLRRLCAQLFPLCDAVITVSDGIAARYELMTGIRPEVVLSAKPVLPFLPPAPRHGQLIRLLYHGGVNADRDITSLIRMAELLDDRFRLDMYLVGDPAVISSLKVASKKSGRSRVMDAVPYDELVELGNQYDMGLVLYEPRNLNLRHCMPNKLFEYLQSHLAIVCGPLDDAGRLVKSTRSGIVLETTDIDAVAKSLNRLSRPQIDAMRHFAFEAGRKLNSDSEDVKVCLLAQRIVAAKHGLSTTGGVAV